MIDFLGVEWALQYYDHPGQIGLEPSFHEYSDKLVALFDEVQRVLKLTATLWCVLGDMYSGSGPAGGDYNAGGLRQGQPRYMQQIPVNVPKKSLCCVPERFKMVDHGWILRNSITRWKKGTMPHLQKSDSTTIQSVCCFSVMVVSRSTHLKEAMRT